MNGFERFTMRFGHQRAIKLFGQERSKWRHHFCDSDQALEESLIRSDFVGAGLAFPESPPVAPHVPI